MTEPRQFPDDLRAKNNAGFIYSIDHVSARRQLHLSLGVIVVLGVAIVTAAFNLMSAPSATRGFAPFMHAAAAPLVHSSEAADRG